MSVSTLSTLSTVNKLAKARSVPIEEVIASRGHRLRRCGGELIGPCPVCGGRDRFAVNPKKAVWNCRGCGKGGDVIHLVRHLDGCGFNDAIEQLTGEKTASTLSRVSTVNESATFNQVRHTKARAEDAARQR